MALGIAIMLLTPCVSAVLAFVFFRESWRMRKQGHNIQVAVFFLLAAACAALVLWSLPFFPEAIRFLQHPIY
ncbi:hypothetical protein AALB19_13625 [Oscillospiraceae bacterium 50-58]